MRNLKSVMRVISKAARDLAEIATGAVATIIAFMLWSVLGCKVLVASWVVAVVLSVIVLKRENWLFGKRIKAVVIIAIIALVCSIFCLVNNHKKAIEQPIASTEVETQEETQETVTEEVAVSEEADVQPKSVEKNTAKRLTEETRKDCIDLSVSAKGQEHLDINGSKEARGEDVTSFVSNESEVVVTPDSKIVEEAKASEDKVVGEMTTTNDETGEEEVISAVSKKEEPKAEEKKDESTKIDTSDASDCVSGETEEQKISKENTAEQTVKEEDLSDFSAEDLKDLAEETVVEETTIETVTIETVETVDTEVIVEDVEVEVEVQTPAVDTEKEVIENEDVKVEEPAVEKTEQQIVVDEEIKVEEIKVEEEKVEEKVIAPVVVTAIDGYTTFVGSQLQFQVSGDDVIIEGLDGINHTFSNGILTIDTGSEATIISVSISNSVNAVDFDITVNGIIG